ncbi:MAG TPA: DUF3037 domain-containing protein [Chitinophagales bacterium]|nr:DUF3037 domain-containing protein [Chitinophagales bacterium]
MQEKHSFEYAVIRVVPRVEREEFVNVGVVLFCKAQKFLQTKWRLDSERLKALSEKTDIDMLRTYLEAFERIGNGSKDGGDIAKLPQAERFRWLTATRSTVVQTSKVHPGLCGNAAEDLEKLFAQLVA